MAATGDTTAPRSDIPELDEQTGTSPADDRARLHASSRFARNTMALVAGRLVIAVAGWAGTVLIARELSVEQFGQFTLVFSILGMLSIITDLGVGRVAVSALLGAEEDRPGFAGAYIVLRTVLGILGYVLAQAAVWIGDFPSPVPLATAIGGLVVLFATPGHAYEVAFQVKDRLTPLAVAGALAKVAQLAVTVALVVRGGSLVWFVVPAVLNDLLLLLWKAPAAHRLTGFRYRIDLQVWTSLLREAVPLSLGAAFVTLYYRIDSVMLSKLDTFEAVGAYGVAYKFVDLVHFVPTAVGIALLAPLTAAWPDALDGFHQRIRESLRLLGFAAGAALVGFWLFASEAVGLLYGSRYQDAGPATAVVVTGETLAFVSTVAITALIAVNRHRWYPVITLTGLALNLVLNFALIPRYSFEGAAVATLITELIVVALLWGRLRQIPGWTSARHLRTVAPLVPAVAAGSAVGLAVERLAPWVVAATAAVVVYTVVATVLHMAPARR